MPLTRWFVSGLPMLSRISTPSEGSCVEPLLRQRRDAADRQQGRHDSYFTGAHRLRLFQVR